MPTVTAGEKHFHDIRAQNRKASWGPVPTEDKDQKPSLITKGRGGRKSEKVNSAMVTRKKPYILKARLFKKRWGD